MKTVKRITFTCIISLIVSACSNHQMHIQIPSKEKVVLDYPNYDLYMANLQNRSLTTLDVSVVSKNGEEWVRSFGLGAMGSENVRVEKENQLVLQNSGKQTIKLRVSIEESYRKATPKKAVYKSFTLENTGKESIPLLIPNVMNPNLSPFSKSAVDLQVGQQILFKSGLKKHILLTVDETISNGDVLNVGALLAARKKELGL